MARRQRPNRPVEKDVVVAARRQCCLCVFLFSRTEPRRGQIAHLNHDPGDSRFENLVYLCLEHHDEYDSRTSQSKGLLLDEVREYRDRLYAQNGGTQNIARHAAISETAELEPLPDFPQYEALRKRFPKKLDYIDKAWRFPLWQVADEPEIFAYKGSNRFDGVCLIERIDLPDGRIVIVCIAIIGNPGSSITNSVETLCFQVCQRFNIPADKLIWIEHYDYFEPQEWKLVTFEKVPPNDLFSNPRWTPISSEMWKNMRLQPKAKLKNFVGSYESKVSKLFPWPPNDE
jgi:hypothetical protein